MGSFKGHALPGSFFFIMGFWWSTKSILKYVCKKQKRTCHLGSKTFFHRIEILEGIVIISMALTGIAGEQFISGGPYLTLYKEGQWNQLAGWHHCTMYFFFGLLGVANILCFTISSLPVSLSKLMLSNALFVETFIFQNHTHGREVLDVFVHQMLVLVSFLAGLLAFMEFLTRNNVLLELLRTSLILLQGSWLWQIGFVLYPPSGGPAWDLTDHENIMFLTICFCWHYALAYVIIGVNYAFITWLVKSRLRRLCSSEIGLLKNTEREHESEEEM
ncbi:PREDICTED: transmembrane protein 45A-like isoform X2 [Chinchilla lanigera]|uniref:Transmembrane protein 45A-like n=2 Tax=Chinchilla lanigera TaxID=34839 RepID=A0A8C2VEH4_CHILA|nr:PREDICTED: transmembrane protein 45A-like isoform X2 [Chinchilla lanigera]XP_005386357.1 PREDICTED: transmembrane protein 45A-like isoform X2 [Chinchilla lanigera]XP_005386358.1 PREDICTED: transmembrane protein 45A-like isoform X2 [Chinchilla lanigera]XP_013370678.1 PREDICTED: transmembrane protein 45A-like isoform X2 [Chinchilla lanigera]XP_013370679.1 PREDICTED: transmembrane protein 45A-like isoform X2 [Chinchilla lanigera]